MLAVATDIGGANIVDEDDCDSMDDDENIDLVEWTDVDCGPVIWFGKRKCDIWQSLRTFSWDVNDAVVVIGNENALWCDTVNGFDVITEKLFAATTAIQRKIKNKNTRKKKRERKKENKNKPKK